MTSIFDQPVKSTEIRGILKLIDERNTSRMREKGTKKHLDNVAKNFRH